MGRVGRRGNLRLGSGAAGVGQGHQVVLVLGFGVQAVPAFAAVQSQPLGDGLVKVARRGRIVVDKPADRGIESVEQM